ncbi:MAG: hypothetical protein H6Q57_2186 [Geobacteraceae bacterium]|nr:hypothetical protein [Geobacteraceae bacterium]
MLSASFRSGRCKYGGSFRPQCAHNRRTDSGHSCKSKSRHIPCLRGKEYSYSPSSQASTFVGEPHSLSSLSRESPSSTSREPQRSAASAGRMPEPNTISATSTNHIRCLEDINRSHIDSNQLANFSCAIINLLSRRFLQIQDERDTSERKRRWRGGEIRTTQPNQRPLQVRRNGKDARTGGKYTSGRGKKSNVIGPAAESISQNDARCD